MMKWKKESVPKHGDMRVRFKFAFFPVVTECNNERYTVWLETYGIKEWFRSDYFPELDKWELIEKFPLFGGKE